MGLNPTILRQVRAFLFVFSPSNPAAGPCHGYRASGFVLTSIRDVAQTSQMRKQQPFPNGAEIGQIDPKSSSRVPNIKNFDEATFV
jgi:hypothetical protein